jgi:hypothetical protein
MRASLLVGLVGAVALALASPAVAKGGGGKGGGHAFGKGPGSHAAFARGVGLGRHAQGTRRPPGWDRGRKTGWRCAVGTPGCIPPGLR